MKIKFEGPQGSGKSLLMKQITKLLIEHSISYIANDDAHEIIILSDNVIEKITNHTK